MARTATIQRTTNETQIELNLDLDGTGKSDCVTGVGFLDHMLDHLAKTNRDIFHRVVVVDMQISVGRDFEVERAMPCYLLQHMFEKRDPGIKFRVSASIQVQCDIDLGFQRVATDIGTTI